MGVPVRLRLGAALVLAVLAGCGGEERFDVPESEISELVVRGFVADPEACREVFTQNFVEQRSGEEGEEAFEACEAIDGRTPVGLESAEIEIRTSDANSLIASADLVGGTFDGSSLIVSIVSEDGTAKLDAITDADIQRSDYERYAGDELASEGVTKREIDCVIKGFEDSITDERINDLIATGGASSPRANQTLQECLEPPSKRALLAQAMRRSAEDEDEDPAVVGCAVERIRELPGHEAERLFDEGEEEIAAVFETAVERCAFAADPDAEA